MYICPIVEIDPPLPPPANECVLALGPKGGEQYSLGDEELGEPNSDDWIESLRAIVAPVNKISFKKGEAHQTIHCELPFVKEIAY